MSCIRLYVEPTEDLMSQERKKRLLGLLKQWIENMRGHNSLFIVITSKDNPQEFQKAENKYSKSQETILEGNISTLYIIIEDSPTPPWICPLHTTPPYIQPFSTPSSVQPPTPPPSWYWDHDDDDRCPPPSSASADKDSSERLRRGIFIP